MNTASINLWKHVGKGKQAKIMYVVIVSLLLILVGCSENISDEPILEKKRADNFNLVIKADKRVFQNAEAIDITAYFEYIGEQDIKFEQEPSITVIVRDTKEGNNIKTVDFNDVQKLMKKGEKFSEKINDLKLEKGKYEVFVQTSNFSVGSKEYSLSTEPRVFEVK